MALIGYARVSTGEQNISSQREELTAAGCSVIHEEHASGGNRARPVLTTLLRSIAAGDSLVVVRLDRLARSLSHLLEVIEGLERRGASFRSLRDPIDSGSPQGKFAMQVLGAAAELERSLIRDRTISGLRSAREQGRVGGNPALVSKDPRMIRRMAQGRRELWLDRVVEQSSAWMGLVRRQRPHMPWEDLVRLLNSTLPAGQEAWSEKRLLRAVRAMVDSGMLESSVLGRAPRRSGDDRQLVLIAAIHGSGDGMTLEKIAMRLEQLRERTPRGRSKWSRSSVANLLNRARDLGLVEADISASDGQGA
ncbi:recombinase family protein [Paracoccus sp. ME4]|uniref:recombinase family protein n=1 Tax=Paracoccus sp. ME4 TaxID=3138066 RepID=UPI00398A5D95